MWLMTTKDRPQAAEATLWQCWETGMRQPGVVYVDGDNHTQYDNIKLPDNWTLIKRDDAAKDYPSDAQIKAGNLAGSKQYIFKRYPNERCYGWVSDDNWPVTPGWSDMIEELSYPWRLVHCQDMFVSEMSNGIIELLQTKNLGGGICWGGELIRCVGWWAPPNIIQGSIDWAWTSLVGNTPLGLYVHDILVRHDNWRTGRREKDDNDNLMKSFIQQDVATIGKFRKTKGFENLRERAIREYSKYVAKRDQQ